MAAVGAGQKGLVALFKRGWHEIPEVLGGCFIGILGLTMGIGGVWNYYRRDGDNRRYKFTYVVVRPDDPKVAKMRKD